MFLFLCIAAVAWPSFASAPQTDNTKLWNDTFVGPYAVELPHSEVLPLIVAQSYILSNHAVQEPPSEPPSASVSPRLLPGNPVSPYSEEQEAWKAYLKRLTTPEEYKVLDCIATKESKWRNVPNYLYDGEQGRFTAFGPFQVLKSTAAAYSTNDRREPYENIRIAVALYRARGSTPWLVWRQCIIL